VEGSISDAGPQSGAGADRAVDPNAFCGVAARMLAAGGRANIPSVLILLSQALRADVELQEPEGGSGFVPEGPADPDDPGAPRSAIPQPRIRSTVDISVGAVQGAVGGVPIDLPVRWRGAVIAVLSVEPSVTGVPDAWAGTPGPLGTVADLLALTLAAEPADTTDGVVVAERRATDTPSQHRQARAVAEAWFDYDEHDRAELAGQLHDGLGQSLIAARYLLDLAAQSQPDGAQPWLATLRESLQEALADGRGLLTSLQPRTRHERGLRLALEEFSERSRFPVTLIAPQDHQHAVPQLSPVVAAAAYRFAQSAVADLRQRGASAAEVRLAYEPHGHGVELSVDVAPAAAPGGVTTAPSGEPGLALERWARRIDLLGGRIVLDPDSAHLCFGTADGEATASEARGSAATDTRGSAAPDTRGSAAPSASPIRTPLSAGRTK
jgi:hypothetical protein